MADLFISIHHDSVQPHYLMQWEFEGKTRHYSDVFRGFSVFYSGINGHPTASARFAKLVGEELVRAGFAPTLHHAEPTAGENGQLIDARTGVYRFDELVVLRTATMPAVLIECGVIVNREEELHVSTAEYRRDLVAAVANAVDRELINAEPGNDSRCIPRPARCLALRAHHVLPVSAGGRAWVGSHMLNIPCDPSHWRGYKPRRIEALPMRAGEIAGPDTTPSGESRRWIVRKPGAWTVQCRLRVA